MPCLGREAGRRLGMKSHSIEGREIKLCFKSGLKDFKNGAPKCVKKIVSGGMKVVEFWRFEIPFSSG